MFGNDKKRMVTAILGPRDKKEEGAPEEGALETCVSEFIDAVHERDVQGAVDALRACFTELDSEPHAEGPHLGEE